MPALSKPKIKNVTYEPLNNMLIINYYYSACGLGIMHIELKTNKETRTRLQKFNIDDIIQHLHLEHKELMDDFEKSFKVIEKNLPEDLYQHIKKFNFVAFLFSTSCIIQTKDHKENMYDPAKV